MGVIKLVYVFLFKKLPCIDIWEFTFPKCSILHFHKQAMRVVVLHILINTC